MAFSNSAFVNMKYFDALIGGHFDVKLVQV